MISYNEALVCIRAAARSKILEFSKSTDLLSLEPGEVQNLMNRIASEDLVSLESIPSFDNSSMDGFALRSEWTTHASVARPVTLQILGTTYAGDSKSVELKSKQASCIEIMTGAPMPEGADAVVKVEDVTRVGQSILIKAPLHANENVRANGTDFHPGQRLLRAGARISSEHILGLATVGIAQVRVKKKPKIALVSTGNELVSKISDAISGGMIRNSTAPYLMSAFPLLGAEGIHYGLVKDDAESFKTMIQKILKNQPDVIITTGAVSKGKLDFVPDAFRDLGAEVKFHGVAIKPGKPLLFAEFKDGPAVFAVPGNPISTAVALRFFINPYLQALQGMPDEVTEPARLKGTTEKAQGLTCFWKAVVETKLEGTQVTSLAGQESYRVSSLMPANAWILFSESGEEVKDGSVVQTLSLYPKLIFESENHEGECC